jgi:polyisoprenoid-binding protein YceI
MKLLAVAALAAAFILPAQAQQKIIPEKSFIRFAFTQMKVAVEGKFRKFDATIAFDPARPEATFTAASVKSLGGNKFEARGPLAIKGTSREIIATFTATDAAGIRTVEGQFPLKRLQYKIGEGEWTDTDTVADDILVKFRFVLPVK